MFKFLIAVADDQIMAKSDRSSSVQTPYHGGLPRHHVTALTTTSYTVNCSTSAREPRAGV